jgi:hypothetical protein
MTTEEYETYQADTSSGREEDIHVRVSWDCELECTYVPRYIAEMEAIRQHHDCANADVRLVFGFDS